MRIIRNILLIYALTCASLTPSIAHAAVVEGIPLPYDVIVTPAIRQGLRAPAVKYLFGALEAAAGMAGPEEMKMFLNISGEIGNLLAHMGRQDMVEALWEADFSDSPARDFFHSLERLEAQLIELQARATARSVRPSMLAKVCEILLKNVEVIKLGYGTGRFGGLGLWGVKGLTITKSNLSYTIGKLVGFGTVLAHVDLPLTVILALAHSPDANAGEFDTTEWADYRETMRLQDSTTYESPRGLMESMSSYGSYVFYDEESSYDYSGSGWGWGFGWGDGGGASSEDS